MAGATDPPQKNKLCYGLKIADQEIDAIQAVNGKIQLKWLLDAYNNFPDKSKFFNSYLVKLTGTETFRKQVEQGLSEEQIRESWQPAPGEVPGYPEKIPAV